MCALLSVAARVARSYLCSACALSPNLAVHPLRPILLPPVALLLTNSLLLFLLLPQPLQLSNPNSASAFILIAGVVGILFAYFLFNRVRAIKLVVNLSSTGAQSQVDSGALGHGVSHPV